jgi:hypothetical protein
MWSIFPERRTELGFYFDCGLMVKAGLFKAECLSAPSGTKFDT